MTNERTFIRLPHYTLRGGKLYFLVSKRPFTALDADELPVWAALDTERTLTQLAALLGKPAEPAIERLAGIGVCEELPSPPPPGRRKVIVFEPHSDDAALSVGGIALRDRQSVEFTIVTLASISNFTTYLYTGHDFFSTPAVTELRKKESQLFARTINGRHINLDLREAHIRFFEGTWTREWYEANKLSLGSFQNRRYAESDFISWNEAIREFLTKQNVSEIWIPCGIGEHVDHGLARDACLSAIGSLVGQNAMPRPVIKLYLDVPYAWRRPQHIQTLRTAIAEAGGTIDGEVHCIDAQMNGKLHNLKIYASQFKVESIKDQITGSARLAATGSNPGGCKSAEALWSVQRLPSRLPVISSFYDFHMLAKMRPAFDSWRAKAKRAKRIRLLLLAASGDWRRDSSALLAQFPDAAIEVHALRDFAAEFAAFESGRISISMVERGAKSWMRRALTIAATPGAPIAFISGTKRERQARLLARLWPGSPVIVLPSLAHLSILLDERR